MDSTEFTPEPEAFMDENENGVRDAGANLTEPFIDFISSGIYRGGPNDTAYNSEYYGILQGPAYKGQPKSIMVFSNLHIVMATSAANISLNPNPQIDKNNTIHVAEGGDTSFTITVQDLNGNTMALGTTVAFSLASFANSNSASYALAALPFTFPNSNANHGAVLPVTISNPGNGASPPLFATGGTLTVTVTSPSGYTTPAYFQIASP